MTSGMQWARRAVAALAFGLAGLGSGAAGAEGLSFSLGFGGQVMPDYFGADTYRARPWGFGGLHDVDWGPIARTDPGPREDRDGFAFRGAFRVSHARLAEDHAELTGLDDVPWSLEAGAGASYTAQFVRVHAELRYGVIGHQTLVGELGGDLILRPGDRTTLTLGPRLQYGSDAYAATYYGVSAGEAAVSAFSAFEAEGGLLAAGLQLNLTHRLNEDWSVRARLDLRELVGSAADSPITRNGASFQARAGVTLVRRFNLNF